MPLTNGTRLGPYEIVAPLGSGGMGEVYRARDTKLNREVAIKILPDLHASDSAARVRFEREAKVLAALNHPNIAAIYGFEDPAIVMELVEGPTLAERIQAGPLGLDEALRIALAIAEALEAAHEKGIVHRDLKPANVKAPREGTVKVLDLGLATALPGADVDAADAANSPTLTIGATQAGVILGTAAYMSPEQASGRRVDKRTDVWSFGVVLWEMLTGHRLFEGETVSHTLADVLRAQIDFEKLPAAMPGAIRELLKRCLDRDVKTRLRDIGEARVAIQRYVANPASAQDASRTEIRRPFKSTLAWAAVTSLALFAGRVSFLHFREATPAAPDPVRFEILPPAPTAGGNVVRFAVSPDGRQLAFTAAIDRDNRVWVRTLDSLDARPVLSESALITSLSWSPDGRFISYQSAGKLKRFAFAGGAAQTVCEWQSIFGGAASWSRNGVIVFSSSGRLAKVAAVGGAPSALTQPDSSRNEVDQSPSFLPDGRHFLYSRVRGVSERSGLYVGSLDVKPEQQSTKRLLETSSQAAYVPSPDSALGHILFVREGTLMAQPFDDRRLELAGDPVPVAEQIPAFDGFSASANGVLVFRRGPTTGGQQLTWLDRQGNVVGTVGEPGRYNNPVLSPDGTRGAIARISPQDTAVRDIWLLDFARGTNTRFTFGPHSVSSPVWSPDGSRLAYRSDREGVFNLYQKPANSEKDEEVLLKSSEDKTPTSWSRDGRLLLYTVNDPKTKGDIWVLPLEGDRKPLPVLRTEFAELEGQFSPDGRWIAYTSNESGPDEIYVRAFAPTSAGGAVAGGGKWIFSKEGGYRPRWRADGKELIFFVRRPNGIDALGVDVTVNPVFQAGQVKTIFQSGILGGAQIMDVTPDGQRFLFLVPVKEDAPRPFTVVLNWQAGLKK